MESRATAEQFKRRLWLRPISHAVEINEEGLVLGAGTILARMTRDASGAQVLALDEDQPRLLALLAAAYGRSPASDLPVHLESAALFWKRGDKALANIRLAIARLPRIDDGADAYRLFLAESLLAEGMAPEALMKLLGLDGSQSEIAMYDPDQPRVPAGNGRISGEWTSGGAGRSRSAPKARASTAGAAIALPAAGTLAEGLFSAAATSQFLAGLRVLAARIGTGGVLGAVIVWPGKSVVSRGAVPATRTCAILSTMTKARCDLFAKATPAWNSRRRALRGATGFTLSLRRERQSRARSTAAWFLMRRRSRMSTRKRLRERARRLAPLREATSINHNFVPTQVPTSRTALQFAPSPIRRR